MVFSFASLGSAQSFSFGVKAGVPLTDAVNDRTLTGIDTVTRTFSGDKQFLVGPMIELHLPLGFSVEADGLYRRLSLTTSNLVIPQTSPVRFNTDLNSWEIPIVAKYHLPTPLLKPYIEAGPAFRTVDGNLGNTFSNSGFTAGGGVELKLGKFRLGPEIRYVRWTTDNRRGSSSPNVNQAEFLVGFSF